MDLADVKGFAAMGAAQIELLHSGEVSIAGTSYVCAMGSPLIGGSFVDGGESLAAELVVQIRKNLLADPPARNSFVLIGGRKWAVKNDPPRNEVEAVWTLRLEPHN